MSPVHSGGNKVASGLRPGVVGAMASAYVATRPAPRRPSLACPAHLGEPPRPCPGPAAPRLLANGAALAVTAGLLLTAMPAAADPPSVPDVVPAGTGHLRGEQR